MLLFHHLTFLKILFFHFFLLLFISKFVLLLKLRMISSLSKFSFLSFSILYIHLSSFSPSRFPSLFLLLFDYLYITFHFFFFFFSSIFLLFGFKSFCYIFRHYFFYSFNVFYFGQTSPLHPSSCFFDVTHSILFWDPNVFNRYFHSIPYSPFMRRFSRPFTEN